MGSWLSCLLPPKPSHSDSDVVLDHDGDLFRQFEALEEWVSRLERQRAAILGGLADLERKLGPAPPQREGDRRVGRAADDIE
jgi:hypothetical protein